MHIRLTDLSVSQFESQETTCASQVQEWIMILFLNIITTVCIGLLIGTEFSVSVFINPILHKLDDRAQAQAIRLFAKRLGFVMPFWYCASLLLLIAGAILRHHSAGEVFLIASISIWAAVIIHTVLVLVPINNRMIQIDASEFSPQAKKAHRRWDLLHRLRVVALASSMVFLLTAIFR
jgi:uncharacterized membrane protein